MKQISEKTRKIIEAFSNLSERQKILLEHRFVKGADQAEVARIFGLSQERVRQLEELALEILEKINK